MQHTKQKLFGVVMLMLTLLLLSNTLTVSAKTKVQFNKDKDTKYAKTNVIIYEKATTESDPIDTYVKSEKIKVLGTSNDNKWHKVKVKGKLGYIQNSVTNVSNTKVKKTYKGKKLNSKRGVVSGPSGRETYYNMYMGNIVKRMRNEGYSAKKYPYWVRKDGCKMLGQYIIVAANFKIRKRGTVVETSLGKGLVCDTGGFVSRYPRGIDVATTWR